EGRRFTRSDRLHRAKRGNRKRNPNRACRVDPRKNYKATKGSGDPAIAMQLTATAFELVDDSQMPQTREDSLMAVIVCRECGREVYGSEVARLCARCGN